MDPTTRDRAVAHHQAGRLADAEAIYRQALLEKSADAEAMHLLGLVLHQSGRSAEALDLVTRAAELRPSDARIQNNLGEILRTLSKRNEAAAALRRAIELEPDYAAAHSNLGLVLAELGRLDESVAALQNAIRLRPDYANAYGHLGQVLTMQGRHDEALAALGHAIRLSPRSHEAHNNLGKLYRSMNRVDDAIVEYRKSIELKPDHASAHHNLGEALAREGDVDAAIECCRAAMAIRPDYLLANQTMLFMMHYSEKFTQQQILAEHRAWSEKYEAPLRSRRRPLENDRDPNRRLRVGYVSPSFRRHPVGFFMRPIFANHDAKQVEVFAYSNVIKPDSTTEYIRGHTHVWRDTFAMTDDELVEQIRADGIDILVDLTLHMGGNRLLAFAQKPAPVQATYLGYAHTTGLEAMDYKLSDPYIDPPGLTESFHTETIVRLPETNFCCEPEPARRRSIRCQPKSADTSRSRRSTR